MNSRNKISEELKDLNSAVLPGLNSAPTYTVPQGYFDGLADAILARIKAADAPADQEIQSISPLLAGLSRKMPFDIPRDYFEQNQEIAPVFARENEESLVLSFISKEMPYQVPMGYFANFPEQVLEKINSSRPKVVGMRTSRWMKTAVAAVIAGIITISGIFYFNQPGSNGSNNIVKEVQKASTEELDAFLKGTTGIASAEQEKVSVSKEVQQILDNVSDNELEAFLSGIPTDELPIAEDEDLDLLYN